MTYCSLFSRDKFVWVGETGADARDHIRRYGYTIRGMRPVTHHLLKRDTRVNAIAGLYPKMGLLHWSLYLNLSMELNC